MHLRSRHVAATLLLSLTQPFASQGQNPITRENENAGTRDWLLAKTDVDENHRSRAIEGYCSHLSIRAGETLSVYVSMNPPGEFMLDVFRMGYQSYVVLIGRDDDRVRQITHNVLKRMIGAQPTSRGEH